MPIRKVTPQEISSCTDYGVVHWTPQESVEFLEVTVNSLNICADRDRVEALIFPRLIEELDFNGRESYAIQ